MSISTAAQTIVVDETTQTVLTDIEADEVNGGYVREVRVFAGGPDGSKAQVFTLRLRSTTREGIEIATPSLTL